VNQKANRFKRSFESQQKKRPVAPQALKPGPSGPKKGYPEIKPKGELGEGEMTVSPKHGRQAERRAFRIGIPYARELSDGRENAARGVFTARRM